MGEQRDSLNDLPPEEREERLVRNQFQDGTEIDAYEIEELDETEAQKVRVQLEEQEQELTPEEA